jgi:hypothetical protein
LRDAIGENTETQNTHRNQDAKPDPQVPVSLPVSTIQYCESQARDEPKKKRREAVRLLLEILALGAAVLLAIFTYRSLQETKRYARSAQEQVVIMQRQLEATDRPWMKVVNEILSQDMSFIQCLQDEEQRSHGNPCFTWSAFSRSAKTSL